MYFPLPIPPLMNWRGGRGFGADRSGVAVKLGIPGGVLRHGAIDDGEVLCEPYPFFYGTYAIEVEHPQFIARYCEIAPQTLVRKKARVKAGQMIGRVGNQPGGDMLHLELFAGTATGPLTTAKTVSNRPYYRRKDLIDLRHSWVADLKLYLISPQGTTVLLADRLGGPGDNYIGTVFDDQAPASITSSRAPFTGTFSPEGQLSDFDGEDMFGTWTLRVTDSTRGDTGVINSWSLQLNETDGVVPEPGSLPLVMAAAGAALLGRRRIRAD